MFWKNINPAGRLSKPASGSTGKFALAFHACPDPILITRRHDGKIIEANEAFDRSYGVPSAQAVGRTTVELGIWAVEERKRMIDLMQAHGRVRDFECVVRVRSGEHRAGVVSAEPIQIEGEDCLVVVFHDVTAQKKVEQGLRESEQRFGSLAAAAFEGIAITDAGRMVEANDQLAQMLGYRREELLGRPVSDLVAAESQALVEEMLRTHNPGPYEHQAIRKDGSTVPVEVQARSFFSGNRQLRVTSVRDITGRKQAEEALRESKERFELAVQGSSDGIFDWDIRTKHVYRSPRILELLGYEPGELSDFIESFDAHLHPEDHDRIWTAIRAHLETRAPYDVEFRLRTKSGGYRWFRSRAQAVWNADNKPVRMAGSLTDIHDHKVADESLRQAQEQALESQEEFTRRLISAQEQERKRLANELHDSLGQNLSLIKNRACQALEQPDVPPGAAVHVQAITALAADAITEVRNLAQNLRPLHIDEIGLSGSLESLVEQVVQSGRIQIERRFEQVDDLFRGDEATILYRIVQEALNNLVKHSQATWARVLVERDLRCIRIRVEDNGRGFDMNAVVAAGKVRTGIGLTSIRERVRMLGGSIEIQSEPGLGTRIKIELPTVETAGPASQ